MCPHQVNYKKKKKEDEKEEEEEEVKRDIHQF